MKLYRNTREKLKTIVKEKSSILLCTVMAALMTVALCMSILATTGDNLQADRSEFDKNPNELHYEDMTVSYQLEDGWELEIGLQTKEVNADGSAVMQSLQEGTDYAIENDSVLLRKEYLATLEDGQQTFCFTAREVLIETAVYETGESGETEQTRVPETAEEKLVINIVTTPETEAVTEQITQEENTEIETLENAISLEDVDSLGEEEYVGTTESALEVEEKSSEVIEETVSISGESATKESEEVTAEEVLPSIKSNSVNRSGSDVSVSMKWAISDTSQEIDQFWNKESTSNQTFIASLTINVGAVDYAAGDLEIRIPYVLWKNRSGQNEVPSAYGIPLSPSVGGSEVPFHYSIDTAKREIVIKNYNTVNSASNFTIQFTYTIDPTTTIDMSKATLQAKVTAKNTEGEVQTGISNDITLTMDTSVRFRKLYKSFKEFMYYWNTSYVQGEKPDDFEDFCYVVYTVSVLADGNQKYQVRFTENPGTGGEVVNVVGNTVDSTGTFTWIVSPSTSTSYFSRTTSATVVVRYPRNKVDIAEKIVTNEVAVEIIPFDEIDEPTSDSVKLDTTWVDYDFHYTGQVISISKDKIGANPMTQGLILLERKKDVELGWMVETKVNGYNYESYSFEVIDDFMDWKTDSGEMIQMSADDYEHTSMEIRLENRLLNKQNGEVTIPQENDETAGEVEVWALVDGATEYQLVDTYFVWKMIWLEYRPRPVLPKGTYQVKMVVKNVKDYFCFEMYYYTTLKGDSPTVSQWMEKGEVSQIDVQNYCAVKMYDKDGKWINKESESNYSDSTSKYGKSVVQRDIDTYGDYMQRSTKERNLVGLTPVANSGKVSTSAVNNTTKRQVTMLFGLYSFDYYKNLDTSALEELLNSGVDLSREEMVFYDLLPLGMYYDDEYGALVYDINGVQTNVTVDVEIVDNFKGTGRQMVIFKVSTITKGENYSTGNAKMPTAGSSSISNDWVDYTRGASGFQVRFRAIVKWEDIVIVNGSSNLMVAQVPDSYKGNTGYADIGDYSTAFENVKGEDGKPVFYDIDGDGDVDSKNIRTGMKTVSISVPISLETGLSKTVKAAETSTAIGYQKSDVARTGSTYTYRLTVQNGANSNMSEVVLFDILENANGTGESSWKGTINSISVDYPTKMGINPTVYYSTATGLTYEGLYSAGGYAAINNMLETSQDWTTTMPENKSSITAIAIDLSKTATNAKYTFSPNTGTSVMITMDAPEELPDANYALNNPAYYSTFTPTSGGSSESSYLVGTRTTLGILACEPYLIKSSDPEGGKESTDATLVSAGDIITYTITYNPGYAAQNIVIKDTISSSTLDLVAGSITYQLPDGTTGVVDETDSKYFNTSTKTITWPAYSQDSEGEAVFSFQVLVKSFNSYTVNFENKATATIGLSTKTSNTVTHMGRYVAGFISKTAALITNVDYLEDDLATAGDALSAARGFSDWPVATELGQIVEYRITVSNSGIGGEYIVTDNIPEGTTLVSGSITGVVKKYVLNGWTGSYEEGYVPTGTVSYSEKDGVITWMLDEMISSEDALLTFRVIAPKGTDLAETEEYETKRVFTNTANLLCMFEYNLKYKKTVTIYNSKGTTTFEEGTRVYSFYEYKSDTTYHQVVEDKCKLAITKELTEPSSEKQQFVFEIEYLSEGEVVNTFYQVITVPAGAVTASVNIINLPPGTYRVTELESNWRYTIDAAENSTQSITLENPGTSYGVTFTNQLTSDKWVDGKNSVTNIMPKLQKEE